MDFSTWAGGIPEASPIAMLEIKSARKACNFTTRIRNNSRARDATRSRMRKLPLAGMKRFYTSLAGGFAVLWVGRLRSMGWLAGRLLVVFQFVDFEQRLQLSDSARHVS